MGFSGEIMKEDLIQDNRVYNYDAIDFLRDYMKIMVMKA